MLQESCLGVQYSKNPRVLDEHVEELIQQLESQRPQDRLGVAIYGMGPSGFYLAQALPDLRDVHIVAYVDKRPPFHVQGLTTIQPNDIDEVAELGLVIVATAPQHYQEVAELLCSKGVSNLLYLFDPEARGSDSVYVEFGAIDFQIQSIAADIDAGNLVAANLSLRTCLSSSPLDARLLELNDRLARAIESGGANIRGLIDQVRGPMVSNIQIIDNCNLKCVRCVRQATDFEASPFFKTPMTREVFRQIAEGFPDAGVGCAYLGGSGEVLLHPDILYFVDYLTERGVRVHLITNGTLLRPELALELAKRRLLNVELSLDGFSADSYEAIRVGSSFDKVTSQFRFFAEETNAIGNDIKLSITSILMKRTIREFPRVIQYAAEIGVPVVNANHCIMNGTIQRDYEESLAFHPELCNEVLAESEELARQLGVVLQTPPPFLIQAPDDEPLEPGDRRVAKPSMLCHEPWTRLDMGNGGYSICCGGYPGLPFTPEFLSAQRGEEFSFSFMTGHRSIAELYACEHMQKLRRDLLLNTPSSRCKNCVQQSNNVGALSFDSFFNLYAMNAGQYDEAWAAFSEKFAGTDYLELMRPDERDPE